MNDEIKDLIADVRYEISNAQSEADYAVDYANDAKAAAKNADNELDKLESAIEDMQPANPEIDLVAIMGRIEAVLDAQQTKQRSEIMLAVKDSLIGQLDLDNV